MIFRVLYWNVDTSCYNGCFSYHLWDSNFKWIPTSVSFKKCCTNYWHNIDMVLWDNVHCFLSYYRTDLCEKNLNFPMCPKCDEKCDYTSLTDSCSLTKVCIILIFFVVVLFDLFILYCWNVGMIFFDNIFYFSFSWHMCWITLLLLYSPSLCRFGVSISYINDDW